MLNKLRALLSEPDVVKEERSEDRIQIATCVVLLEVANADNEFSDDERNHVVATLREHFGLSADEATELIEVATEARKESLDLWQFTNALNESLTQGEKMRLLEEVWRVVFADGILDGHEDHLTRQVAKLLNLHHSEFIAAKVTIRAERAAQGLD